MSGAGKTRYSQVSSLYLKLHVYDRSGGETFSRDKMVYTIPDHHHGNNVAAVQSNHKD